MKYLTKIKELQVEISNFCNADCLGCLRSGEKAKRVIHNQKAYFVEPSAFANVLTSEHGKYLETIEFCGTIDEPLAHPRFLDILNVIYDINPKLSVRIHTNGAVRDNDFYIELGNKIKQLGPNSEVRFSIDGKAHSVWLYRGIKNYDSIIKNAKTYIDTGARAVWQMLSFPWNENEVEDCKTLAKDLNFKKFVLRRDRSQASKMSEQEIEDYRATKFDYPPIKEITNKDEIVKDYMKDIKTYIKSDFDDFEISCHFQNEYKMFIDYKSRIWPCCFLANNEMRHGYYNIEYDNKLFSKYGEDFNNLNLHKFDDIMNGEWFAESLTESWNNDHTIDSGCLAVCVKQCSKKSIPIGKHLMEDVSNG